MEVQRIAQAAVSLIKRQLLRTLLKMIYADFSRRSSYDVGESRESEMVVVLKERRLVELSLVKEGMMRFSFLLESTGTLDPQLLAAILDLVIVVCCQCL